MVYRCRGIPYAHNADRSGDAVRFQNEAAKTDLSVPIAIGTTPDNVGGDSCCQNFRFENDVGPPGRFPVPTLQGFGNLEGLKSCWLGTQTLTGQKDAVRFTKKVAVLDLKTSARPVNVDCTGLKSSCKAREPAVRLPEKVCRSGTGTERARDGTTVRIRDGTVFRIRDGTALHPDSYWHYRETDLGIHNRAARQPVHPPEWEW
jgi:hypothetical protein